MDVKKLVVGFLVLAVAAGVSASIISAVSGAAPSGNPASQAALTNGAAGADANTLGSSAFTAGADADANVSGITTYGPTSTASSSDDPNNLTDQLANTFFDGVVAANPDGLTEGTDGNPTLTAPDSQTVADQVASLPAAADLQVPDWDTEAAEQPITIGTSSAPSAIANYSSALNDIFNTHFVQTGISAMVNETNEDPSQAAIIEPQVQAALRDASTLVTPPPLLALQKSLIVSMVYEKNLLALVQSDESDPVKASILLQDEQDKYNVAMQNFATQMQDASAIDGFSMANPADNTESGPMAFVNRALGIQTASAQFFGGFVFDSANFGQWLEKFANDIVLQIAKNAITATIQKEVLTAIQGSGAPEFVTNWGETLVNAYQQSALSALNGAMSCVNSAFAPQIRLTIGAFYQPDNNLSCVNSFEAALGANSVQQFYNNFSNGGFIAYGASMLPSGNYYGGLYDTAQIVNNSAQTGQQATQAEDTSAGGFTGQRYCTDGSNPNGSHLMCVTSSGAQIAPTPGDLDGNNPTCPTGDTPITQQNNGYCSDGSSPPVSTPGTFTGFSANAAVGSGVSLVSAANDIAGLLNAAANSLISTLSTAAISAANSAVNQTLNGGGAGSAGTGGVLGIVSSTIQGGGVEPAPVPLSCSPYTQNASTSEAVILGASGGTTDSSGNQPNYYWTSSDNQTSTGFTFSPTFGISGTYIIRLSDSANDTPTTCTVIVGASTL